MANQKSLSIFLVLIMCLPPAFLLGATANVGKRTVIKGFLVDMTCVLDRSQEISKLGLIHTKKCLQMPACERSGYAIMDAKNNVFKFDTTGNALAKKLISATAKEGDWEIVASGRLQGDQLTVTKLQLKK
jgi:hypothetical protein